MDLGLWIGASNTHIHLGTLQTWSVFVMSPGEYDSKTSHTHILESSLLCHMENACMLRIVLHSPLLAHQTILLYSPNFSHAINFEFFELAHIPGDDNKMHNTYLEF